MRLPDSAPAAAWVKHQARLAHYHEHLMYSTIIKGGNNVPLNQTSIDLNRLHTLTAWSAAARFRGLERSDESADRGRIAV